MMGSVKPAQNLGGLLGGDVADEKAMTEAFDAIEHSFGGIDVVVHTAGLMILGPVADFDLDDLDRMHRTNIRGTFVVDQLAARRVRDGGAIVNFSSSVVKAGDADLRPVRCDEGSGRSGQPLS